MKIRLGEKEIDLAAGLPVTLDDCIWLHDTYKMALTDIGQMKADAISNFLHAMVRKIDPDCDANDVARAETVRLIRQIPMIDLPVIVQFINNAPQVNRPTSGSSTS